MWTPRNTTNNMILSVLYYAEFKTLRPVHQPSVWARWRIAINEDVGAPHNMPVEDNYGWSPSYTYPFEVPWPGFKPNQPTYSIRLRFSMTTDAPATLYVRNVNVIITVADGMPASN